ncbi:hypothetical protein [Nonomuraea dietziae]|uniref:hypothetical protein n=1 Tax=Nonomuraea dietziae TaxID=65515 RepID=UPI0031DE31CB
MTTGRSPGTTTILEAFITRRAPEAAACSAISAHTAWCGKDMGPPTPGMNLVMSTASTSSSVTASSQVIHSRISQAPPAEKQS